MKPDCYECKYRDDIPGSAHSYCKHPKISGILNDPFANIMATFASVGRANPLVLDALGVCGTPIGIARGWFNWPWNFDPLWLESCEGFEAKEKQP